MNFFADRANIFAAHGQRNERQVLESTDRLRGVRAP
jgi:hypothetical protein